MLCTGFLSQLLKSQNKGVELYEVHCSRSPSKGGPGVEKDGLTLEEYLALQMAEMLSSLNRWGAGLVFGHDPNDDELAYHYVACGASDRFRQTHPRCDA